MDDFERHLHSLKSEISTPEQKERLVEAMKIYKGEDKIISSHDVREMMRNVEVLPDYPTGIATLDRLLGGGIRPKQLVTLAAPPKSGKTSWCIELTANMRAQNPVWFPIEESPEELIEKFLDRGEEPPLFYFPQNVTQPRNLRWIEERIVEAVVKFDSKIVFIDHIGKVVPKVNNGYHREYDFVVQELKDIAKKWNVAIVMMAHVNKQLKIDEVPVWTDIAESAAPGKESDIVLMLWRRQARTKEQGLHVTNDIIISVDLIRRGKGSTGKVKMTYDAGHYKEADWMDTLEGLEEQTKTYGRQFE